MNEKLFASEGISTLKKGLKIQGSKKHEIMYSLLFEQVVLHFACLGPVPSLLTKLNARLALQQRTDLLLANILANKSSLPQGHTAIPRENMYFAHLSY